MTSCQFPSKDLHDEWFGMVERARHFGSGKYSLWDEVTEDEMVAFMVEWFCIVERIVSDFGIQMLPPPTSIVPPNIATGHLRACADLEWMPSTLSRPSLRDTLAANFLGFMIPVSTSGEIESLSSRHLKQNEEFLLVFYAWLRHVCFCC